jgi:hypothetical protein
MTILHHGHPVLAKAAGFNLLKWSRLRLKNDVSDSDFVLSFFAAAAMADWRHACWNIDFGTTHRTHLSRTISPLCRSL